MKNYFVKNYFANVKRLSKKTRLIILIILLIIGAFCIAFNYYWFEIKTKKQNSTQKAGTQSPEESPLPQPDFWLKIPKIDVVVPVVENVDGNSKSVYNKALEKGVAHYQGTSLPGQGNNIFIFGHSSSAVGSGAYAKIFERLGDLEKGDEINVFYKDKEYSYIVKNKKIVEQDETDVLDSTKKEQLTIMTCWPIGTNEKRLIVIAKPKT